MRSAATSGKSNARFLGLGLLAIVVVRLSLAALVYARPTLAIANDSDRYIPIANGLINGTAYAWTTERPGELLNTVGYPLFLAGVFALIGPEAGDIALAQLALSGALALGLYLLLFRWVGAGAAFVGSLLLALDPLSALWSMTILTETVFAAALGFAAALTLAWAHDQRPLLLILAGFCMACAALVKPFALLVAATWIIGLMLFPSEAGSPLSARAAHGLRRALLFSVPIVLLIAPWFVRNRLLWNCTTLSSVDRVTMRDYMAAKVLSEAEHIELAEAQARLQRADPGVCPTRTSDYLRIILAHPGIYAKLHLAGTVPILIATNFDRWLQYAGVEYTLPDLWRPYMDDGWQGLVSVIVAQLRESPGPIAFMLGLTAFQLGIYALATHGFIAALRSPGPTPRWIVLLLAVTIAVLILTPGQGGHERFRVPVQPMLCMLIGYGLMARAESEGGLRPGAGARSAR